MIEKEEEKGKKKINKKTRSLDTQMISLEMIKTRL